MNVKSMARVKYSYNLDGVNLNGVSTSNVVSTEVRKMGLLAKKFSSSDYFKPGDIMTYNIVLTNSGNSKTNNIVITDIINNQELLTNTIKYSLLNNQEVNLTYIYEENIFKIQIPYLEPNDVCVITYKTITSNVKEIKSLITIASDEVEETKSKDLKLKQGYAHIECYKQTQDDFTYLNSDLTYDLILKNTGNISAYNVEIYDELPVTFKLNEENPLTLDDKNLPFEYSNNILTFSIPEVLPESELLIKINGKIIS